ncbi:MAG TPA: S-methyl-5'-thioinosine phosphorylase [Nevskiaceae bacterium]|nr:S-methyl-5'-thioinosine phosphorylase [Nevskiaceae bacterium]
MTATLALIGGTGFNQWEGLQTEERREILTPYGPASAPLLRGRLGDAAVWFLARHGEGHRIPPHAINYRANLWALREVGVTRVIAIAAVGAIAADFPPGAIALPHDLIDYTWGREHSYADGRPGSGLQHVELSAPYAPALRQALLAAATRSGTSCLDGGVMAVTQGPRLETPAEIRRLRQDGATMVGMTGMPEAALAAELGLAYACLAVSVNWAAGLSPAGAGIHDEIHQSLATGMDRVRRVLAAALPSLVAA